MSKPVVSGASGEAPANKQQPTRGVAETVWSYVTSVKSIRRRDGRVEDFDPETLAVSVRGAFEASGLNTEREHARIQAVVQDTINRLTQAFDGHTIPESQDVKELVGASLIDGDLLEVAKVYLTSDVDPKNAPMIQLQQMPLAKTFFSPAFGMVADKFGKATVDVQDSKVRALAVELVMPRRGTCRYDLTQFRQTQALPSVELAGGRDCRIRMWEQGETITVSFANCPQHCNPASATDYVWPLLIDRPTGQCD